MSRNAMCMLCVVLGIVSLGPSSAEAEQPAKVHRIGWLSPNIGSEPFRENAFLEEMRWLGYVERRNLEFVVRMAEGKPERLPALAAELVSLKPDVIVALSTTATRAVKQATATIPIVMVRVSDPVGSGFVASLARPGGNITGASDFDIELSAKSVELVHLLTPQVRSIAVLMSDNQVHPRQLRAIQEAAARLELTVVPTLDRSAQELEEAFCDDSQGERGSAHCAGALSAG